MRNWFITLQSTHHVRGTYGLRMADALRRVHKRTVRAIILAVGLPHGRLNFRALDDSIVYVGDHKCVISRKENTVEETGLTFQLRYQVVVVSAVRAPSHFCVQVANSERKERKSAQHRLSLSEAKRNLRPSQRNPRVIDFVLRWWQKKSSQKRPYKFKISPISFQVDDTNDVFQMLFRRTHSFTVRWCWRRSAANRRMTIKIFKFLVWITSEDSWFNPKCTSFSQLTRMIGNGEKWL